MSTETTDNENERTDAELRDLRERIVSQVANWSERTAWAEPERAEEVFEDLEANPDDYLTIDELRGFSGYHTAASHLFDEIKEEHDLEKQSKESGYKNIRLNKAVYEDIKPRKEAEGASWAEIATLGMAAKEAGWEPGDELPEGAEESGTAPTPESVEVEVDEDRIAEIARRVARREIEDGVAPTARLR